MSVPRRYHVVDVFGSRPLAGNALAVVHDADALGTAQMQAIARWTNLSETAFLLQPSDPAADYRVRIFTPSTELPFAGHPTLGAAAAWMAAGGVPRAATGIVQECAAGLIQLLERANGAFGFVAPPLVRSGPVDDETREAALDALGIDAAEVVDAAWVDNGPGWLGLRLTSAAAVLALDVPSVAVPLGVVGLSAPGSAAAYEVRAFLPEATGTIEDPVTGSLQASIAMWLLGAGIVHAPYVATQGRCVGADGRVGIEVIDEGVLVVGATHVLVEGTFATVPDAGAPWT